FELAHGGTLFLDEIGDLSAATQAKLLRVLQEREFTRVGGSQPVKVDVRIIAATNKQLDEMIRRGEFRDDLYYRINVLSLYLPALRDRRDDIPLLARNFLDKRLAEDHRPAQEFSKDAMELLVSYHWPGNVRELENVIEQAIIWSQGHTILPEHLPATLRMAPQPIPITEAVLGEQFSLEKAVLGFEKKMILDALKRTDFVQTHAAALLGISRRMLKYRMDMLGITRPGAMVESGEPDPVP
ncbi:MAG: sigma 54-interacting transcriptional regulator, partial [Gammaproteobacteria bacterium]